MSSPAFAPSSGFGSSVSVSVSVSSADPDTAPVSALFARDFVEVSPAEPSESLELDVLEPDAPADPAPSAKATAGIDAIAAPTPSATASAPTLPTQPESAAGRNTGSTTLPWEIRRTRRGRSDLESRRLPPSAEDPVSEACVELMTPSRIGDYLEPGPTRRELSNRTAAEVRTPTNARCAADVSVPEGECGPAAIGSHRQDADTATPPPHESS